MASDVALYLRKKFVVSLNHVKRNLSSDHTFQRFEKIGKRLGEDSTSLTDVDFIPLLYKLNDALADWRILKEQKNVIKEFVSFIEEALSAVENKLNESAGSGVPPIRNHPDFPLDRFKNANSDSSNILGFDEHVQTMIRWLSKSGEGFKAVGIYGMGGSGKTALVKKVLKEKTVGDKFKRIIWTCLTDLTREEEIDIKVVKYILYDLGFDIDSMSGSGHEDGGWLLKQLEHQLHKLGNYVLVLDDVWHCSDWLTTVLYPALATTPGGAVIVTSRIEKVARERVGTEEPLVIDLSPSDDKNYDFFEKMVQRSAQGRNRFDTNQIVRECHGLPLAAKMLPLSLNATPSPSKNHGLDRKFRSSSFPSPTDKSTKARKSGYRRGKLSVVLGMDSSWGFKET